MAIPVIFDTDIGSDVDDAIALLTIALPGKPVNTLGRDVMLELSNWMY